MDHFAAAPPFNSLSLADVLEAREQFHVHLMHKANVIGTAVGRYLIRKDDPYPTERGGRVERPGARPPRTIENSEVRDYSWPCVLVFVSEWGQESQFGAGRDWRATDLVPKRIYLPDGRQIPICTTLAPPVETLPPPVPPEALALPPDTLAPGVPMLTTVQGTTHVASIGCLVSDGRVLYALTSRHVAGRPGERVGTVVEGRRVEVGRSSFKQIGRQPFSKAYPSWPGARVLVNMDVALVELDDQSAWSPTVYGVGQLGPLADLSVHNLTLALIGCPVRAHGAASGRMYGQIAALFYRYQAVGGFEHVADFLIGARAGAPLRTRPGDSGTVWVVETDDPARDLMPVAVQWGGAVFGSGAERLPFALATNLSNVCRDLEVDVVRSRDRGAFEYWGAVGHYAIGALACGQVAEPGLRALMLANRRRVSFDPGDITPGVDAVTAPGFVPLADVPDKVWKKHRTDAAPYGRRGPENPNHYADLDFAPPGVPSLDALTPTAAALTPQAWRDYYAAVHWNSMAARGLLPFRVWQLYRQMVREATVHDVARFVACAGVLAHYVGDACQPLHGSYLTDGDPFRRPDGSPSPTPLGLGEGYGGGVHSAYEDAMLDANASTAIPRIEQALGASHGMALVTGGAEAGFAGIALMRRARQRIPPIDLVETYGRLVAEHKPAQGPAALWEKFGAATIDVIADGCRTLAMLWESAWMEGQGPQIAAAEFRTISRPRLQRIYERQDFVPSVPLAQIDPLL